MLRNSCKKSFKIPKGVIRSCILVNDRQHSGKKKTDIRTNNDLQNITLKIKDWTTGIPIKSQVLLKGKQFPFHM